MEPPSPRPLRRMQSFEIDICSKAPSRDAELPSVASWDDGAASASTQRRRRLRRMQSEVHVTERMRQVQRQFESDLAEARLEDTQDLEMLDFIRLGNCDREGRQTMIFIAQHVPHDLLKLERTQRFVMQKLESVGHRSFSLLYVHTGSNLWNSQAGLRAMWSLFSRIPWVYRKRLDRLYILHPDICIHVAMWVFVRWCVPSLWEKVRYLSRLDALDLLFPAVTTNLPPFVKDHDQELGVHPLMDYGVCTLSEVENSSNTSGPVFYT